MLSILHGYIKYLINMINWISALYLLLVPGYNTRRIQGFNIRLSNTTQTDRQEICYQDDGKTSLPPIIEQQCKGVAQFVWIYTNKTSYDGAVLEICEVQVYGCSYQDSDGNCISCDQCKSDCNILGECDGQGCKSENVPPPFCKACRKGFYGRNCSRVCGHCAENLGCDQVNGSCSSGQCEPGWSYALGYKCNTECPNGVYGEGCQKQCGYCEGNRSCHHITGSCLGLCKPGYLGERCQIVCNKGFYGKGCLNKYGHCDNDQCHHINTSTDPVPDFVNLDIKDINATEHATLIGMAENVKKNVVIADMKARAIT